MKISRANVKPRLCVYYITNVTCIITHYIVTNRVRFILRVSQPLDEIPFTVYIVCESVEEDFGTKIIGLGVKRGPKRFFFFLFQNVIFFVYIVAVVYEITIRNLKHHVCEL